MSFKAIRWAFSQTAASRDKLVLLALANRANDRAECWPSMKAIAIDCGMSRHTVLRSIARLKKLGLISFEDRTTYRGKSSHLYRLLMDPPCDFDDVAICNNASSKLRQVLLQDAT